MPFTLTPKPVGEMFELMMPRVSLEVPQDMALYVLACTDSQTMPLTIVGHTKAISQKLLAMVSSGQGFSTSELLKVEFTGVNEQLAQTKEASIISHEANVLCSQFTSTVCTMEIMCRPSNGMLKFVREQMGLPTDANAMENLQAETDEFLG